MKEKSMSSSSCSSSAPEDTRFQYSIAEGPQVHRLPAVSCRLIDSAATKIQAAFRGYLGRRALKSLKALVKLQALVRGFYIRRRTQVTLRCLFSLLRIQGRARRRRLVAESPSPGFSWAGRKIDRSVLLHQAQYFPRQVLAAGHSTMGYNEYRTKTSEYSRSTSEVLLENYTGKNGDTGKISGRSNGSCESVYVRQPYDGGTEVRILTPRKLANGHDKHSSLRHQPSSSSSSSTLKTKLGKVPGSYKNGNGVQVSEFSPPAAPPNYMAFTQSSKARRLSTGTRVSSSAAGSPSSPSSPPVNLHEGRYLPPIRTRRSSFPVVETDLRSSETTSSDQCRRRRN